MLIATFRAVFGASMISLWTANFAGGSFVEVWAVEVWQAVNPMSKSKKMK